MNATHTIKKSIWPEGYPFAVVALSPTARDEQPPIALFKTEANAKRFLRILEGRERRKERRKQP